MRKKILVLASLALVSVSFLLGCDNSTQQKVTAAQSAAKQTAKTDPKDWRKDRAIRFFYIVLDTSGSMGGQKIKDASAAVRTLMNKAPDDCYFGLCVFTGRGSNGGVEEIVPICSNSRELIKSALPEDDAGCGTPLGASLEFGTAKLEEVQKKMLGYGYFNILVVTDGEATDNLAEGMRALGRKHEFGAPVTLYTIGFHLSGTHALSSASVLYREASDKSGLESALNEMTKSEAGSLQELIGFK